MTTLPREHLVAESSEEPIITPEDRLYLLAKDVASDVDRPMTGPLWAHHLSMALDQPSWIGAILYKRLKTEQMLKLCSEFNLAKVYLAVNKQFSEAPIRNMDTYEEVYLWE